jgi:hypothetical protein
MKSLTVSMVLITLFLISASIASSRDYSALKTYTEELLLDPALDAGIVSAGVSITPQQVTANCITLFSVQETSAPTQPLINFIGSIVGIYSVLVKNVPEVGDLVITAKKNNEPTVVKVSCPKSWIEGKDLTSADSIDQLN